MTLYGFLMIVWFVLGLVNTISGNVSRWTYGLTWVMLMLMFAIVVFGGGR